MNLPTLYNLDSEPLVASVIFWQRLADDDTWTQRRGVPRSFANGGEWR